MHNKNDNDSKKHSYEHTHMHDHDHDFVHLEIPAITVKDLALLEYILDHNKQHTRELADTGGRLAEEGFANAAELISDAVRCFNQANDQIEKAVRLLNESIKR